jgi:hypothetical protein
VIQDMTAKLLSRLVAKSQICIFAHPSSRPR